MSNLTYLCKYVIQAPWRLLQITVTIITITKSLLASIEHKIVLLNGFRTAGKLHLLFQPTAGVDGGQMAGFRGGEHSFQMQVDVDEL